MTKILLTVLAGAVVGVCIGGLLVLEGALICNSFR